MTDTLTIATNLSLPLEAATENYAIVAMTGAGKTYTASVLAEEMLQQGLRVCILDPLGVWSGLKSSADGNAPGFPVLIFGGRYADIPLDKHLGDAIGRFIGAEHLACLIDLSNLDEEERYQFTYSFIAGVRQTNEAPLHIFVDEADEFIPQVPISKQHKLTGRRFSRFVRQGRVEGFSFTLITQRPALISKDVWGQVRTLIALQMTATQDISAIEDWIRRQADTGQMAEVSGSLASLKVGEAWFWSVASAFPCRQRLQVRQRLTFDSSAKPKLGQKQHKPRQFAQVDLERLREQFTTAIEQVQSNDPEALRQTIANLQAQLHTLKQQDTALQKLTVERVAIPVLDPAQLERLEAAIDTMQPMFQTIAALLANVQAALATVQAQATDTGLTSVAIPPVEIGAAAVKPAPRSVVEVEAAPTPARTPDGDRLSALEQRILNAIAMFEGSGFSNVNRRHVAIFANSSPSLSGYFKNTLGSLRSRGYLEYPNAEALALTATGRIYAQPQTQFTTNSDLHEAWFQTTKLPTLQRKLLRVLVHAYPQPVERQALAKAVGLSESESGHFKTI